MGEGGWGKPTQTSNSKSAYALKSKTVAALAALPRYWGRNTRDYSGVGPLGPVLRYYRGYGVEFFYYVHEN